MLSIQGNPRDVMISRGVQFVFGWMACSLEAMERSRVDIPRREAKSGDRANPTRIHQPTIR